MSDERIRFLHISSVQHNGNGLDSTAFSRGCAPQAFDLTRDLGEDDQFNLAKQGSVRLMLREALNENTKP